MLKINQMFELNDIGMFATASVRELMFDGYNDPVFDVIDGFEIPLPLPFDQFGWFYPVRTRFN